MPKRMGQKQKSGAVLSILTEHSDEEHPLPLRRIISLLQTEWGICAERKSVYDDIECLRSRGYDVITVGGGRSTAYYLGARNFELAEWKLLLDAVQSCRLLSEKKAEALIGKLLTDCSVWQREKLSRQVWVANRAPVGGETVLYAVDALSEAMNGDLRVRFRYTDRNLRGERVLRHGGKIYEVSPWALCWDDEFYYLIAYDSEKKAILHFRVDRMESVTAADLPRDGKEAFRNFDMGIYSRRCFGMFGGETVPVTLRCHTRLSNVIWDRFGGESVLRRAEGDRFDVTVSVMLSPAFYSWVLGFGAEMEILSPSSAREDLVKLGREALRHYVSE